MKNTSKDRLESMSRLGVAASKAGEAIRELVLALSKLENVRKQRQSWERPYKYHR